jgi:hypothetical protein
MNFNYNEIDTIEFSFQGDITIIIQENTNNSLVILFRFAQPAQNRAINNINYQRFEKKNTVYPIFVQINNTFVHSYQIYKVNNSIFISFFEK